MHLVQGLWVAKNRQVGLAILKRRNTNTPPRSALTNVQFCQAGDKMKELNEFINSWSDGPMKEAFLELKEMLEKKDGVELEFKARPGISYSLRGRHKNQKDRNLFVMIDVIDDDPDNRWLSICFYGDMITDPDEKGNLIPGGLQGEDGYCFDLDSWEKDFFAYIKERIEEAYSNASKG